MIYYFVAYYTPDKAFCYHADTNSFKPYNPIYRRCYKSFEQAQAAARHARHKNPEKRRHIFVDSALTA